METPETIEAQDRKDAIIQLVQDAKWNPLIDSEWIKEFLWDATKEMEFYKYYGDNSKIKEFMDNEVENDTHWLQSFLWNMVWWYTIYQVILSRLI